MGSILRTFLNFFTFKVNLGRSTKPRPLPSTPSTGPYFAGLTEGQSSYSPKEINQALREAKKKSLEDQANRTLNEYLNGRATYEDVIKANNKTKSPLKRFLDYIDKELP